METGLLASLLIFWTKLCTSVEERLYLANINIKEASTLLLNIGEASLIILRLFSHTYTKIIKHINGDQ